jgi:hypothetical protein
MSAAARWSVSLAVAVIVAAASLLAGRLAPAPQPSSLPVPSAAPAPSPSQSRSFSRPASPSTTQASRRPTATSSRTSPSFRPIRIAATAARNELFGVEATKCPTCASGSRVKYVGQGHGIVVPLRDIPSAGRRSLTIYYESDGTRPLQVAVADDPVVTLMLTGNDSWIVPAQVELTVDIPAGDSAIKLFHPDKPAPDLDQIIIR